MLRKVVVFNSKRLLVVGRDNVFFVFKEKEIRLIACISPGLTFMLIYTCFVRIFPVSKKWFTGYWNSRVFTSF